MNDDRPCAVSGQADRAVILFGHGARDPDWARPMILVRADMLARAPGERVELAFLEFMTPTLDEIVDELAASGVRQLTVVPMFLAQGGHLKRDLPLLLQAARLRHPACELRLGTAIGEAPGVLRAMADHALSAFGQP